MPASIALHAVIWTVILSAASPALAYVPSRAKESRTKMRWMETNCIFMRINSAGSADIQDGSDITAAAQSIEAWRSAVSPCSYLDFVLLDSSTEATPGYDSKIENENIIYWQETKWPHEKAAAALTTVVYIDKKGHSQDGRILDADIELNGVNFTFSTSGHPKSTDVQNTVTHELGHLMGLDHTCRDPKQNPIPTDHTGAAIPLCEPAAALSPALKATTMFPYTGPGDLEKRSPEVDDVQGICETYPLNENPGACVPHIYTTESGCAVSPSRSSAGAGVCTLMCLLVFLRARRRRF